MTTLAPAARAFDAVADRFDTRFGEWLSVAAQRRAVRRELVAAFPPGARLLEIGGGTGDDAAWLMQRGREVLHTDASPTMVALAAAKLGRAGEVLAAEDLPRFAERHQATGRPLFDGVFSNFAALNCVADLSGPAAGLARMLRPGAAAMLVLFGTHCPGELLVEGLRRRPQNILRRLQRGAVPARLGGVAFSVRYHRAAEIERAMAPWFTPAGRVGIGVAVPPSAAEPWISRHPRLLAALVRCDELVARPLSFFGDHVLYRYVRR